MKIIDSVDNLGCIWDSDITTNPNAENSPCIRGNYNGDDDKCSEQKTWEECYDRA